MSPDATVLAENCGGGEAVAFNVSHQMIVFLVGSASSSVVDRNVVETASRVGGSGIYANI